MKIKNYIFFCMLIFGSLIQAQTANLSDNANLSSDITYGIAGGEELKLDISVPEGDGLFPVCILVHGGGFSKGDKQKQPKHLFKPLSEAGFAWVSINYRLAPTHKYPASVEDLETAILWVKAHAKEFHFDPSRIVLIGESAGAYLVNIVGAKNKKDTRVAAVVSFYGAADLLLRLNARNDKPSATFSDYFGVTEVNATTRKFLLAASPITYVRRGLPAFLLLHGNKDETVPYEQSVNFFAKLKAAKVPAEFITIEGGGHGMSSWNKINSDYAVQVVNWLKLTLKPQH
ncbi:alpha/beta hydrolase [Flavobacterium luteum]|uniref:Alpha/beta hydrolase n=1 Tax=Flavobacterium luteum TaxID=2026654 RepID=A0A7J5A8Y3_9FLAO|nr:alpha/beta hydrolase [Flavobacterium luteum]KAB1154030.1 alpha/beta hydrolase [Flavobacterium luteum]